MPRGNARVRRRRALLPRLRRARRRLTLAFPRGISYQCPTFRLRDGSVRSVILRMLVPLVALATVASTADAQRRARRGLAYGPPPPSVGFRVGYDFDADHTFLGVEFNLPVRRRWTLVPSAEFYLGATGTPYRLNADLKYHPPTAFGLFYFGGGFAYLHASRLGGAGRNAVAG